MAMGSMDPQAGSFHYHPGLLPRYAACSMQHLLAGHPRPWRCCGCGGEFEDSPAALFPWCGERRDLHLLELLRQMER